MLPPLRAIPHHLQRHVGAGIICAVGYFDPGNWSVDIQAGTTFGYRPMLFVILTSGTMAVLFQILATRLGCITGLDLAAHCRILLYDHPNHPRLVRFLLFYPLYILVELAIIATDLAELLGSAIGFTLLIPALPIWASVLLTALDVFVFLLITDQSHAGRPVRPVEIVFILLVAAVFVSFIILVIKVNPAWSQAFLGFVPSNELFETQPNAVYTAIGIVGATVMPHGLFLGSHLGTQDRLSSSHSALPSPFALKLSSLQSSLRQRWRSIFSITRAVHDDSTDRSTHHGLRQNNSLSFIQAHLTHATMDIALSLLVVAVPINSAILILSVAVPHDASTSSSVGIFSMYDLILNTLGKGAAFLFALALVFSGQAASITATLAGQIVSEGFILWSISPFLRRLITRLLSLIPSMVVAMAFGRSGINCLLVASQVALSIVLPFVVFPLIFLTSSKTVMSVNAPKPVLETPDQTPTISTGAMHQEPPNATPSERSGNNIMEEVKIITIATPVDTSGAQPHGDTIDFSNSYVVSAVAYAIWLVISIANVYGFIILSLFGPG